MAYNFEIMASKNQQSNKKGSSKEIYDENVYQSPDVTVSPWLDDVQE